MPLNGVMALLVRYFTEFVYAIVVKFEEINLKFGKFEKVKDIINFRKSSRSRLLSNIVTLLNFMQYNAVQQDSDYTA